MAITCCVRGCSSKTGRDNVNFYRFPDVSKKPNLKELSERRVRLWLSALRQKKFDGGSVNLKFVRICSRHFISGKKAKLVDDKHPDWIPTQNMGYYCNTKYPKGILDRYTRMLSRKEKREEAAKMGEKCREEEQQMLQNSNLLEDLTEEDAAKCSVHVQTDLTMSDMNSFDVSYLQSEIDSLRKYSINTLEEFEDNDEKVCFFTGISQFVTLKLIFHQLETFLPFSQNKLTKFQVLLLTLMHIRLDLSFKYLSYRFNVSTPTISKYFKQCINILYCKFKSLIYWPDREVLKKTMPLTFKKCFGDKITTIVDCFEIFIEKSSNIKAAAESWSNYKHAFTVKYLIAISPQGTVMFISPAFGGRASDKYVTENSSFLENIAEGDVVMADRGFLINDALESKGARLNIPAFTRGQTQLHPLELENSRNISNVRIEVERVIGLLKMKYPILHKNKFKMHELSTSSNEIQIIHQIVTVSCALINLCRPICMCEPKDDNIV